MATITTTETLELQPYPKAVRSLSNKGLQPRDALHLSSGNVLGNASHNASSQVSIMGAESDLPDTPPPEERAHKSMLLVALAIGQPSLVNFVASFTNGIITVALPTIAHSLDLPRSLFLWPSSVYGLTSGSVLLLAGSVADLVGARNVELAGVAILTAFTIASGLARTGEQLVAFRALQGIGMALHLPSSVSLVAAAVPSGRARNVGFAFLGLSQPLGFSLGLVLAGVLVESAAEGWRTGFYIAGAISAAAFAAGYFILPRVDTAVNGAANLWAKLRTEIDWVGVGISSAGLTLFTYVLAILSADLNTIRTTTTASLFALSLALIASFPFWMNYRTRTGKVALVPNSLWRNLPFTSICVLVSMSWGVLNSMELFSSLYFQEIQRHSSLTTSLLLLPNIVVGIILNFTTGMFVHRVSARWLIAASSLLCACAPLFMAVVDPAWNYWYLEFWAQILCPVSGDILFTVGLIIVSESFPERTQALAGAVFNTVSQLGLSLGVGVCQVVALGVAGTGGGGHGGGSTDEDADTDALLKGYRASFWTMFAYMVACVFVATFGLRHAGKVGVKRE